MDALDLTLIRDQAETALTPASRPGSINPVSDTILKPDPAGINSVADTGLIPAASGFKLVSDTDLIPRRGGRGAGSERASVMGQRF